MQKKEGVDQRQLTEELKEWAQAGKARLDRMMGGLGLEGDGDETGDGAAADGGGDDEGGGDEEAIEAAATALLRAVPERAVAGLGGSEGDRETRVMFGGLGDFGFGDGAAAWRH